MSGIEVFQDMALTGPASKRAAFVAGLRQSATTPWAFDEKGSEDAERNALGDKGILIFQRDGDANLPAARLVLWPKGEGYYVPNITPAEIGQLTIAQYNAVLSNFADAIAKPVARRFGYLVNITSAVQNVEDWMSVDAATALRRFSAAANKSTGASHPMDERLWFDFIIAIHRAGNNVGTDRLARWLHEVEGWAEETAHDLAGEFERGLALLTREAETR
ncbi:hypothetical protein [Xanthobacter wiegelii]|uniref:hypothetical protein n=1 Tax=Xanthobacter wiegelii TaxID=3119913 RepID=UPI00372AE991